MKFIKLKDEMKNLTKDEIYKVLKENKKSYFFKNDLGLEGYVDKKHCQELDPEMKISVNMFDPPSGWQYGFPSISPKHSLKQDNILIKIFNLHNYPKKLQDLATRSSRSWNSECALKNLPDYYFGFDATEENILSNNIKED